MVKHDETKNTVVDEFFVFGEQTSCNVMTFNCSRSRQFHAKRNHHKTNTHVKLCSWDV